MSWAEATELRMIEQKVAATKTLRLKFRRLIFVFMVVGYCAGLRWSSQKNPLRVNSIFWPWFLCAGMPRVLQQAVRRGDHGQL